MAADLAQHPQLEQLSDFALGRLESAALDAVESHLATCRECCDTLNQIKEDTFVGIVRQAKPDAAASNDSAPAKTDADQSASALAESGTLAHTPPAHLAPGATEPAAAIHVADVPTELANHARYRIEELIGTGGMGAVYKAQHRLMQRTVALKVINPKFIQSKQAVERFRREVQAAAKLQHPNIVHAYDAEQAGDVHFLVMEYVKGTDLQKVLEERGTLPVAEACEYIRQAALGLQHAHESGMVHRDIKPQNLMVVSGRVVKADAETDLTTHHSPLTTHQVKILDFGLAALTESASADDGATESATLDSQKSGLTQAGSLMGTPDYMAPEQGRDARSADIRSDIYSLGCTLYTLLAGRVPFPGGTAIDKVIAHSTNQPQPISEVRKDVPAALVKVLDKMMAKEPAGRYQTPTDVAAVLAAYSGSITDEPQAITTTRRVVQAPADALIGVASMVLAASLGIFTWLTITALVRPDTRAELRALAIAHFLYAGFIMTAGMALRGLRWRLPALVTIAIVGVAVPTVLAVKVILELSRLPLWPVAIPQWIGLPFCIWAILVLFRLDVRAAFERRTALTPTRRGASLGTLMPGAAAIVAAAGIIIHVQTDRGTLQIVCKTEDVRVVVSQGGKVVEVIDIPSGAKVIRLPSGDYQVNTAGDRTDVTLDKDGFKITRGGSVVVFASLKEASPAVIAAWIDSAHEAAEAWLKVVDQGKHDEAARGLSSLVRKTTPPATFSRQLQQTAGQIGKNLSRVLFKRDYGKNPPALPPGEYVIVQYASRFEKLKESLESVVLMRDGDGQWRPMSYSALLWALPPGEFPHGMATPLAIKGEVINTFGPAIRPITKDGVSQDEKSWKLEATGTKAFELYEVPPIAEDCMLVCRASMKSNLSLGRAYIEMWCIAKGEKSFSKGIYRPLLGTRDWQTYEVPFFLKKGEQPDNIRINVVVEGKGTVWIKEVELHKQAMPKQATSRSRPKAAGEISLKHREAIDKGLAYLVRMQQPDGHWSAVGGQYPVAMTSLAGMAMLMEGSTIQDGPFAEPIRKAAHWIMARRQANGCLADTAEKSESFRYMFGHGYAMLFLATLYGQEEDLDRRRQLKTILDHAVAFTAQARTKRGGWGYVSAAEGNDFDEAATSIVQLQGLRAARNAGIAVPRELLDAEYLRRFTGPTGGVLYSLTGAPSERPALTAAALAACEYDSDLTKKWLKFCQSKIPLGTRVRLGHDEFMHYYYAQALYTLGDRGYVKLFPKAQPAERIDWSSYRAVMFDNLAATQGADGSWPSTTIGPTYATACFLTLLQLDNGFVPIYQRAAAPGEATK